ncbi:MAG: type II toxin-antitoxin system RelE/ParE family toxin [bacterium]|nr:type II toxin-antitoxin system RelE/ParE family toxin [bacterium]
MISVTILNEAEQELWETVEYYEDKCPGLGFDFEQEVKSSVELIQRFPQRWALRDAGTRRYLIHRFPYIVVYVYYQEHIWVIALAHCKRKPEYWSNWLKMVG